MRVWLTGRAPETIRVVASIQSLVHLGSDGFLTRKTFQCVHSAETFITVRLIFMSTELASREWSLATGADKALRMPILIHCRDISGTERLRATGTFWCKVRLIIWLTEESTFMLHIRLTTEFSVARCTGKVMWVEVSIVCSDEWTISDNLIAHGTHWGIALRRRGTRQSLNCIRHFGHQCWCWKLDRLWNWHGLDGDWSGSWGWCSCWCRSICDLLDKIRRNPSL